jgi:transcriptional regulator with XRE-family HTH domain
VQPTEQPRALARRLRALREGQWHDLKVTQQQLAEAFGGEKPLSESLISSWESARHPTTPPGNRIRQYAAFFATRRSVQGDRARLLADNELTAEERAERDRLHGELLELWNAQRAVGVVEVPRTPLATGADAIGGGPWYFPDQRPVTIICARLPESLRSAMPYANPRDPDYVRSYTYADLDAVIELHGHVRATNPSVQVNIRTSDDLEEDDYTAHLVLLGGVDFNPVTRDIFRRLHLPIRQVGRPDEDVYAGFFEVRRGSDRQEFAAVLERREGRELDMVLREDVALVYRGPSPYNSKRTVTLCTGMYGRGTYGAVRALTDARFRDRNEGYLRERFADARQFGVLSRVLIVNGEAVTPDWTVTDNRLYEWPGAGE